jgi:hypothetical protein
MKATGNILKWSMNFPRMERSFVWRRAKSQPVRSDCKIVGVPKGCAGRGQFMEKRLCLE